MVNLRLWLQQPSSVAGIAAILGTLSALLTHQLNWAQAAPLLAGAVASIVLPDNSAAKAEAETLVRGLAGHIVDNTEKV